ncbi:MAG: hypothetical protein JXM69_19335 [Anaerolineae bacterium]|nr:hypothetical protein [Anaerolineae bacterium]
MGASGVDDPSLDGFLPVVWILCWRYGVGVTVGMGVLVDVWAVTSVTAIGVSPSIPTKPIAKVRIKVK